MPLLLVLQSLHAHRLLQHHGETKVLMLKAQIEMKVEGRDTDANCCLVSLCRIAFWKLKCAGML